MTRIVGSLGPVLASTFVVLACDPPPKNLGADLSVDGAWEIDWRAETAVDAMFLDIEETSDGGVIVLESSWAENRSDLRRFAADGTESVMLSAPYFFMGDVSLTDSAVFVASDQSESGNTGSRASLQRVSYDGELLAEYVHPRNGPANSFAIHVVSSDSEVTLVIGNWGQLEEGTSRYEVQRLDHDLIPMADSIPFDDVAQVAYDVSGDLVVIEASEGGPSLLHRPLSGMEPVAVDCGSLLTGGGTPLCVSTHPPFQITNYETGEVLPLDELDLDAYAPSGGRSSTVFTGSEGPDAPLRIIEVLDGGAIGRSTEIALDASAMGVVPRAVREASDGAVYAIAYEAFHGEMCPVADATCMRGYLVRLAAPAD